MRTAAEFEVGTSPVDMLLSARIDDDWVVRKSRIEFSRDVMRKLRKAVYGIGQRGGRWFSGGRELSLQEASRLLDYAVLIDLLLARRDLEIYHPDLQDCREQLSMQIDRYTEGQPERVLELIGSVTSELAMLRNDRRAIPKR